ncbi:unnamed protein product [Allacma fusca]|uniref:Uncharacterized protein n=1 Tax=Allacma fusca TaxID=39272 RepID=A0A8J2KEG7_9HEXA|nr:unnamed protein product [Allacma fusca]
MSPCTGPLLTLYNDTKKVNFVNKNQTFRDALPTKHFLPHWSTQILKVSNEQNLEILLQSFIDFGAPNRDKFIIVTSKSLEQLDLPLLPRFKEVYIFAEENIYFRVYQNNKILKVQGAPIAPHLILDSHGVIQGGGKFTIMQTIAYHLNYSVQIDPRGRGTGIFKNGTWTGMTGAVYYRQVDFALLTSASVHRYGIVDIVCISPDSIVFVAKNPQIQIQWRTIFHPFSLGLWAAFGLSFLSITIVFYLVMRGENWSNISSNIFSPYRIALEQGCDLELPNLGKFLLSLWIFFILIMGTGYRSDLVAHFSFPVLEETPKDFNELSARKDYRIVFNYLSGTSFNYFQTTKSGAPKSLFRRFELQPASVKCIIAASLNRNTACISWETPMKTRIAGNLSLPGGSKPLVYMSKPLVSFYTGFALQKNSILTDDFSRLVGILRDVGLVTKWDDDVYNNASILGKEWIRGEKDIALPYRALVQFLALIFRPDLDSYVTDLNSYFAVNGTTFNSIACATVEGLVDIDTARRNIQERLFSAQRKHEHRRCITQSPFTVPELNYRRRVFTIWEKIGLVFKIPYDAVQVIWTVRNSCKLSSENIEMDSPGIFSVSPKIPVELVKFIKNRFQVSFAAVIYAIYIGALERALQGCGQQVPKSAAVSFVLPFISNPAPGQISATILFGAWPMKTPSALHRTLKIQKRFEAMSRSTATYFFTYGVYLGAYVPTFVRTIVIKGVHKFFYHSNNFSIFPITTLPDIYDGDEISDIIMCNDTTSGYEFGMSTMIGGLNNQLRFNFHISKGFFQSDEVAKKFPTFVIQELQELVDEANDKGTFFVENLEDIPV